MQHKMRNEFYTIESPLDQKLEISKRGTYHELIKQKYADFLTEDDFYIKYSNTIEDWPIEQAGLAFWCEVLLLILLFTKKSNKAFTTTKYPLTMYHICKQGAAFSFQFMQAKHKIDFVVLGYTHSNPNSFCI